MFFRRLARRPMSAFRLPAAPNVRTIKVAGIVRRHCDLGLIWGRNTDEVEKVHTQKCAQKNKSCLRTRARTACAHGVPISNGP